MSYPKSLPGPHKGSMSFCSWHHELLAYPSSPEHITLSRNLPRLTPPVDITLLPGRLAGYFYPQWPAQGGTGREKVANSRSPSAPGHCLPYPSTSSPGDVCSHIPAKCWDGLLPLTYRPLSLLGEMIWLSKPVVGSFTETQFS